MGENLSPDEAAARQFITKFMSFIDKEEHSPEQVYNLDETELNFKMLLTKIFASKAEKSASGYKVNRRGAMVVTCTSAEGTHNLPLAVDR